MPLRLAGRLPTVLVLLAAACCAPAAAQTLPTSRPGQPRVTFGDSASDEITLPLHRAGSHLLTRARINGQDIGWVVVDTGASNLFLDPEIAQKLKLARLSTTRSDAVGGAVDVEVMSADHFAVGGLTVHRPIILSTSMRSLRTLLGFELAGFFGGDIFSACPITIDLRDDTLTFHAPASFKPPATQPHEIRLNSRIPLVRASLEGRPGWFEIDTGKNGDLDVSGLFLAYSRDLLDSKRIVSSIAFGAGGKQEDFDVRFSPLALLGREFHNVAASYWLGNEEMNFRDVQSAGRIGLGLLRDARLTFDYANHRMWITWREAESTEAMLARCKARAARSLMKETPLMLAAARGRADVLQAILGEESGNVNAADSAGFTALMMAANADENDGDQCVRLLIEKQADVNAQAAVMGLNALHFAASEGRLERVKALLAAKADPNVVTTLGQTPLLRAAEGRWLDIATALLDAGADVKRPKKTGETPLIFAAHNGDLEMARLLLDRGADVNQMTPQRATALVSAARERHPAMVRLLLSRGAAVSMSYAPSTALHVAAQSGDAESIALLLAAGADPTIKDREGKTPFDRAASLGRTEALRVLLDAAPTTGSSP